MHDRLGDARLVTNGCTLHTLTGISQRVLIGSLRHTDALQTHIQAGMVHHREHVGQALVGFADQITDGAFIFAEGHDGGCAAVDAHLVFDRGAEQVVACTQAAIGIDQIFRGNEQRNALHAGRCIGQACQHEVDDIFRHIVLAPGDENLGPRNAVGAVILRNGFGTHRAQIRTGLRFGEVHRAGPNAFHHLREKGVLQLIGTMMGNRFDRPRREHRAQSK